MPNFTLPELEQAAKELNEQQKLTMIVNYYNYDKERTPYITDYAYENAPANIPQQLWDTVCANSAE